MSDSISRRRPSRRHKNFFRRLKKFFRRPKTRNDEEVTTGEDAGGVQHQSKREVDDEPFNSGDSMLPEHLDPEIHHAEQQRNKQFTDQLIQSQKQLEDTCREWESQVRHLKRRVSQAETEYRSLKFVYTKEQLKRSLLVRSINSYSEKLQDENITCKFLKEELKEKPLLEKKLEEASAVIRRLDQDLVASKYVINDQQGQLGILKQKTTGLRVDSETADLREALRKEVKRGLELSTHLKKRHRAVKESIAKQASLRDALTTQERKCTQLKRKIELDQAEIRKILSRQHDLQAALDIDKSIMSELSNRLADHQKLTEELKTALDANPRTPTTL